MAEVGFFATAFTGSGMLDIDSQHYEILSLADELHRAMTSGNTQAMMGSFLERLQTCLEHHFDTEEQLMAMHAYVGAGRHTLEHLSARETIRRLRKSFAAGSLPIAFDTMQFLRDWLKPHMLGVDREFIEFVLSNSATVVVRRPRRPSVTPAVGADRCAAAADSA
jgi:hemerythrin-like metal-binding protein